MKDISFKVNGQETRLAVDTERTLLDVLREDLNLTGAKNACDIGTCGSCTVLANGRAVYACQTKMEAVVGKEILTIEGLGGNGHLHPVQEAFVKALGSQCGFCTPGFVMRTVALLNKIPKPTDKEIKKHLKPNICRCTGYQQIMEAVKLAAGLIKEEELAKDTLTICRYEPDVPIPWKDWKFKVVGKSHSRLDHVEEVTGTGKYTDDFKFPGMLHGVTVRSEYPHARIIVIDASQAERHPGVVRVLTWKDVPGENAYGLRIRDQQVFARDVVRYVGEPIALVVAETREAAREAAGLVTVMYEPLRGVFDPEEAMRPEAPKLHDKGNILYDLHIDKGDVEKGFAEADVIIEREYRTQPQDHAPMEPEAALAYYDGAGKLTLIASLQHVFFVRLNVIRALGIPKEDVRVVGPKVGGAFGKKEDIYGQIHAALATFITRRPVKVLYTREETTLVTTKRTPVKAYYRIGVKRDGKVTALRCRMVGDTGAYASWGLNIMRKAGVLSTGSYEIENVKVDSYAVFTNNPIAGATRGFGAAETIFCAETVMDEAAHAIGMDPVKFRRINALRKGSATATDHVLEWGVAAVETLDEAAKHFGWEEAKARPKEVAPGKFRGLGAASLWYGIGFGAGIEDVGDVIGEINQDGGLTVWFGTVDYGNGSSTTFAMLAAEVTGVPLSQVKVVNADSDTTPNCGSTVASRQTYITGNAVVRCCFQIRKDLQMIASELLEVPVEEIDLADGYAYCQSYPDRKIPIAEVARQFERFGRPRRREGLFKGQQHTTPLDSKGRGKAWWPLAFGAHMAEVEVDTYSGKIDIKRYTAAHYVGRALNPQAVRGQVVGGISFGIGFGLSEDPKVVEGRPTALNFDDYKLMRISDLPDEMKVIIVEKDEPTGPFGAIGIGEPPTLGPAPAILNAVYDAVGVRIRELPATREAVLEALKTARRS